MRTPKEALIVFFQPSAVATPRRLVGGHCLARPALRTGRAVRARDALRDALQAPQNLVVLLFA